MCNRKCSTKEQLKDHISQEHAGQKSLKCEFCNLQFSWLTALHRHFRLFPVHKSGSPLTKCGYCSKSFSRLVKLNEHVSIKHPEQIISKESSTESVTTQSIAPKNDSKITTNTPFWKCKYCFESYSTYSGLQRHYQKNITHKHASKPKKNLIVHKCFHCSRTFCNGNNLNRHLTIMHSLKLPNKTQTKPAKTRPIKKINGARKCYRCHISFTDSDKLRQHVDSKHTKKNIKIIKIRDDESGKPKSLYHCKYCGQSYTIYRSLLLHFKYFPLHRTSKSVNRNQSIKCLYCSRTFSSNNNLNLHTGRMHKQQQSKEETSLDRKKKYRNTEISCKSCSIHFKSYKIFCEHMNTVHNRVKSFKCDNCDSSYTYKHNLVRHQKQYPSHKSESNLKLKSTANKYSGNKVTLRLFKCKACSKVYTSIKELSNHQKKHSKRRPATIDAHEESDTDFHENLSESDYDRNFKSNTSNIQTKENTSSMKIELNNVKVSKKQMKLAKLSRNQKNRNGSDGNILTCLLCNKRYTITTIFEQHLLLHNDLRIKRNLFECKKCDCKFSHKSLLESHEAVHKYFQCDLCHKLFNKKADLTSHAPACIRQFTANFMDKINSKE